MAELKGSNHIEKFGKVLVVLILLLPFHQSYGQDIKIRVLNYDYNSKRVTVKVENHSNDTIWYSLVPIYRLHDEWSEPMCEIQDNATLRSLIDNPKRVSTFLKLGSKKDTIREGYANESMIDWHIYISTHKLHDVPKFSKSFWKIFNEEKRRYNYFEIDKCIKLVGENLRTKEKFEICSEIFK